MGTPTVHTSTNVLFMIICVLTRKVEAFLQLSAFLSEPSPKSPLKAPQEFPGGLAVKDLALLSLWLRHEFDPRRR